MILESSTPVGSSDRGFSAWGLGFGVLGFRVWGLGFCGFRVGVLGSGLGVLRFRVWGLGLGLDVYLCPVSANNGTSI